MCSFNAVQVTGVTWPSALFCRLGNCDKRHASLNLTSTLDGIFPTTQKSRTTACQPVRPWSWSQTRQSWSQTAIAVPTHPTITLFRPSRLMKGLQPSGLNRPIQVPVPPLQNNRRASTPVDQAHPALILPALLLPMTRIFLWKVVHVQRLGLTLLARGPSLTLTL